MQHPDCDAVDPPSCCRVAAGVTGLWACARRPDPFGRLIERSPNSALSSLRQQTWTSLSTGYRARTSAWVATARPC